MRVVVSYRGIPHAPGWATGDSLIRALRSLGHDAVPYGTWHGTDDWMGRGADGADLLIFLECCDGDRQYVELADLDCPKVYWEFDTAIHVPFTRRLLWRMGFDAVAMANARYAREFRAHYLPYGVDHTHFGSSDVVGGGGVAIIGTAFEERRKFADRVGIDLVSGVYGDDYARALSRLDIHVHYLDSGGRDMVVGRPLETMASGVCLLAQDTPILRRHWLPGVHYEAFAGPGECREKIDELMDNPERRARIARNGQVSVMGSHTYLCRAKRLIELSGLWRSI